jgi:hypothetical protein
MQPNALLIQQNFIVVKRRVLQKQDQGDGEGWQEEYVIPWTTLRKQR